MFIAVSKYFGPEPYTQEKHAANPIHTCIGVRAILGETRSDAAKAG